MNNKFQLVQNSQFNNLRSIIKSCLGVLLPVGGTVFDLRIPKVLGDVIDKIPDYTGFDHNFCITKRDGQQQEEENSFVARLEHPSSGRVMEVYSNQPGLQFYNANKISSVTGKNGSVYGMHGAFCVETQNYPDAINHVNKNTNIARIFKYFINIS